MKPTLAHVFLATTVCFSCCFLVVFGRASPTPGLFEGWFTYLGNNPAFKCNKARLDGQQLDNVVIQTRLHSFDNEDDDKYTGSDCDSLPGNACDIKVKVYIDSTTPTDTWPSGMAMTEIIDQWDGNDIHPKYDSQKSGKQHAYTACKFVPKLSLATIRVSLEDVDTATSNDIINNMNCFWAPPSGEVGSSEAEAQWETINCCTAFGRKMKSTVRHELKMDVRAFKSGAGGGDSCPNGEGRLG